MNDKRFLVKNEDGLAVTAIQTPSDSAAANGVFVYAPGAGSNIDDPFGYYLSHRLAGSGFATIRFQFPYMEAGRRRPDSPRLLEAAWRQVIAAPLIAAMVSEGVRLFVGGRSMGGRIASQVVAQGTQVDGLALFAYPLRPPGRADRRCDEHLPDIRVPTLFCSGTRDAFATPDHLRGAAAMVPVSTVHLLDGADHGFAVLKSSGRTREDVWNDATGHLLDWLAGLG